ncbi:hypothetical protein OUZ56_003417 [Daphnia magna]|uniref:Uncharacterized protein n=1 Tax=Daphnia magna TaxID=35525 RepID=A0ABR0A8S5_9CRUS|nr:hypothetical protein OUZ56_003417 [Daphnia magna]
MRGATTDNGSNFVKAFHESSEASNVPKYEDDDFEQSDEEEELLYFEIGDLIDGRIRKDHLSSNVNPTLPLHRRCACHILRFEHMFADNELHLATLTDPFFKLSWLDNEDEIRRAKNLLKGEYVRFQ